MFKFRILMFQQLLQQLILSPSKMLKNIIHKSVIHLRLTNRVQRIPRMQYYLKLNLINLLLNLVTSIINKHILLLIILSISLIFLTTWNCSSNCFLHMLYILICINWGGVEVLVDLVLGFYWFWSEVLETLELVITVSVGVFIDLVVSHVLFTSLSAFDFSEFVVFFCLYCWLVLILW